MKKVFAFILVLCMVLSCVPTFAEGSCAHDKTHWNTTATQHAKICDDCDESVIAQTDHKFTVDKGVFACECGYTFTCEHEWSDTYKIGAKKTVNEYHYKECNKTYCGVKCDAEGEVGLHNDVEKLVYKGEGIYPNTTNYYHTATCTVCQQRVWNLKTSYDADCEDCTDADQDKQCDFCGQSLTNCAHKNDANSYNGDGTHKQTCRDCGMVKSVSNPCVPKEENGKTVYTYDNEKKQHYTTCLYCSGKTYEDCEMKLHLRGADGSGTHSEKCAKCGNSVSSIPCTNDGSATCISLAKCKICGNALLNTYTAHSFVDAEAAEKTHTYKCTVEGCIATKTEDHIWVYEAAAKKTTCKACGYKSSCGHENTKVVFGYEPSCSSDGLTDGLMCEDCGVMLKAQEAIEADGHIDATETIITAATCKVPGKKYVECKACGYKGYEDISTEDAHTYVNMGVVKICEESPESPKCKSATCKETGLDHYVCSNCGAVKHVETEKVDHKTKTVYVNYTEGPNGEIVAKTQPVTCTEPVASYQECTVCNEKIGEYKIERSTGDTHEYTKTKYITPTCEDMGGIYEYCVNVGCEVGRFRGKLGKDFGYLGDGDKFTATKGSHSISEEPVIVEAATCTTNGKQYFACEKCSVRFDSNDKELAAGKYEPINAAGHINDNDNSDLNACPVDHKDNNGVWTYVAPTCKTNGYWESTCSECNGNYRKVSFADKCEDCAADVKHHVWVMGAVITKAICGEKEGTAQTVCSVCGTIAKHTGDASTCLCKDLADVLKHDEQENIAGKDILWKISKEHDWQVTADTFKKPTCIDNGYGYVTCSRCGETKWFDKDATDLPEALTRINHIDINTIIKVNVPADCENKARVDEYCSVCNVLVRKGTEKEDSKVLGHNLKLVGKVKLCENRKPVDVLKYACTRCGKASYESYNGEELNHAEVNDTFDRSEYSKDYMKNFVWETELTCTTDGYYVKGACPKCDYVAEGAELVMVPAGHLGNQDSVKTIPANCTDDEIEVYTCAACGETYNKIIANTKLAVDDLSNGIVTNGNVTNKGGHKDWTVVEYIVKETCTENGKGIYGCPYCKVTEDEPEIVAAKHSWSETLIVDEPATCGKTGKGHMVCSVCGYEAQNNDGEDVWNVTIPATGKCTYDNIKIESGNCEEIGLIVYECMVCGEGKEGYIYLTDSENDITDGKKSYTAKKYAVNEKTGLIVENNNATVTIEHIIQVLPAGEHEWGTAEMREATCTLKGGLRHTCKVCGTENFIGTTGTPALGHDVVCVETPSNCYMDGEKVFSCLRCGETLYTETIAACGHELEEVEADSVASTCSTKGYKMMVCKHEGCGYSYKDVQPYNGNNHKYVIDLVIREATCTRSGSAVAHCAYCDTPAKAIPLNAGHKWEVTGVKTAATCTNKGIDYVKCSVCGATGNQVSKALGHTMVTETVEADCTHTAGIKTYCSVCSYMTKFVKTGASVLGHKWGEKVYVEATCEEDAHYESTCARCKEVAVTTIGENEPKYQAKLNHKGSKLVKTVKATCTERGYDVRYCSLCGEEYKTNYTTSVDRVNGHELEIIFTYGNSEINCGNYGYAKVKCNICGYEAQKYLGEDDLAHSYTDNIITDDIVYKVCTVCGDIKSIWVKPSYTGFNGCGTITIDRNGEKVVTGTHKGLVVKASKDATCTEAGELGHIECTVCGTVIRVGGVVPAHTTKEVAAVEATCTTEGSTAGTFCLVCNKYVVAPQKIAAKGHKWVEVPAQEATATKPGYTAGTQCENCKEWKEGHEETPVKAASLKRTAVLRKTAELLGERVALLNTDDAISITGELVNGFYPVSSADGTGYIHNSYIAVA